MSEKKNDKLTPIYHEDHAKPMTRRELVAQGFRYGTSFLIAPAILESLFRPDVARALTCDNAGDDANALPTGMLVIDLAGGGPFTGLAMLKDGSDPESLVSHERVGRPTSVTSDTDKTYGAPVFTSPNNRFNDFQTGMMSGLTQFADQATLNGMNIVTVASQSRDDTNVNTQNPVSALVALGLAGEKLGPLGTRAGSGGRSRAVVASAPNVVRVSDETSPEAALRSGGALGRLNPKQQEAIISATKKLMDRQKANKLAGSKKLNEAARCAAETNMKDATRDAGVNPLNDNQFAIAYNVTPNSPARERRDSAVGYNTMHGKAVGGTIEMGAYDHHGSTRDVQNENWVRAGEQIGKYMRACKEANKPGFCVVISDGGASGRVRANGATEALTNDDGTVGKMAIFTYTPGGSRRELNFVQIGGYTDEGAVDRNKVPGASPGQAAVVVAANYLAFIGYSGGKLTDAVTKMDSAAGTNLPIRELGKLIAFKA